MLRRKENKQIDKRDRDKRERVLCYYTFKNEGKQR